MTTRALCGLVSLIVATIAVVPVPAFANGHHVRRGDHDRRHHQHERDHRRPTVLLHPGLPFRGPAPGIRFGLAPPYYGYGPRTYVAPPPIYYDSGAAYVPPPPSYVPDATVSVAPGPRVVEHPNGRYELRGDGVSSPYTWIWVPKPPAAPPLEPPPPPPSAAPEPAEPPRQTEIYRWTDETGAVHWTDRWDAVPEAYRATATKTKS